MQRGVLTLDNGVGREFFDKTSLLVGIKIEVKGIYNRHNTQNKREQCQTHAGRNNAWLLPTTVEYVSA